jgi:hypothetical protein
MKISHVSVAVREPERAARALAEIWGGSAHPFFPLPGAWIAFSSEEPSSQVEFYPDRTELEPIDTRDDYAFRTNSQASSLTPTHIALKAPCDRETVERIAAREGWRCRLGNRGGAFDLMDLRIEDRLMVEVITPDLEPAFDRAMNAIRRGEVAARLSASD